MREAAPSDARAIATVHVRAWRAAYRGLLPDQVLDGLSIEEREDHWRGQLGASARDSFTFVVGGSEEQVEGFCTVVEPSRDEDAGERTAEVAATYVDPARWGVGVGTALLDAAVSRLRQGGWREVTLWVFAGNDLARPFYARYGFEPDGAETVHEWAGGEIAVRLRLVLV